MQAALAGVTFRVILKSAADEVEVCRYYKMGTINYANLVTLLFSGLSGLCECHSNTARCK